MRSWMKTPKMPITEIEQKCLTASEICISNGWSAGAFGRFHNYMWQETPNFQDMQMGEVGMNLSVNMVDGIYKRARDGKWICK